MIQTWHQDLTDRFVTTFSEDVVVKFIDGYSKGSTDLGSVFMNMDSFSEVKAQPENNYWMQFSISEGSVRNISIGDGATKRKRKLVEVEFLILWPETRSKKILTENILPALDNAFLGYQNRSGDGSFLFSNQVVPSDTAREVRANNGSPWNTKSVSYFFEYEFV